MTDRDPTVLQSIRGNHRRQPRLGRFADVSVPEDQPADVAAGLVSLGFIWAAVKRGALFWCSLAIVGLLIGAGVYAKDPPSHKASTSVLLTYGPDESPASAVFDNQAIAQSHTVAQLAMKKLGLHESLGTFAASYTVAVVTDRVLQIIESAPSSSEAVRRANAIASAFLEFRVLQETTAKQVLVNSLYQELQQAMKTAADLGSQISKLQAAPTSPSQRAKLKSLQQAQKQAAIDVAVLQQTVAGARAGSSTASAVTGSVVLDPASPMAQSKLKAEVTYAAYGLLGGLVLGLGIIVIRAAVSDKLRRRDDIARALGAAVKLSIGRVRRGRRILPGRRGLAAAGDAGVSRVVSHLRDAVPANGGRAALIVIPVDDADVPALSVAAMAMQFAQEGRRVLLADLAATAPAAALVDSRRPGVHQVNVQHGKLTLVVPPPGELALVGPYARPPAQAARSPFGEEVAKAAAAADLVLALVTLEPGLGSEHLLTWADTAVAVVTAGRSSWTKVRAAGEMIRLAGTSLASVVLVGADKNDETLGVAEHPDVLLGVGTIG